MPLGLENGGNQNQIPAAAAHAVLKPSDPVPGEARQVRGIEFDAFRGRDITVREMVSGMANMGFQASAVADAVRIINEMVRLIDQVSDSRSSLIHRGPGQIWRAVGKLQFFSATLQT